MAQVTAVTAACSTSRRLVSVVKCLRFWLKLCWPVGETTRSESSFLPKLMSFGAV